jgi:phosphate transport system substrate-binding protein
MILALTLSLPFTTGTAQAATEEISIVGTGDGMIILESIGSAFSEANPDVKINVPDSIGSGGGVKSVGKGEYQVGRVARPIKDKEKHFDLNYRPFAKIPVVFFVNKSVEVRDLSPEQIAGIYSGKITNWKEVGGKDAKIRVVRREDGDSSLKVLRKTFPGFKDVVFTDRSKEAVTTQENFAVVEQKSGTIGFGPYAGARQSNVNVLTISGTSATDPNYPSFGTVALIFKDESNKGNIAKFIAFATSSLAHDAIRDANGLPY